MFNLKDKTMNQEINIIRQFKEKSSGYSFIYTYVFFTFKGKLYKARYTDTRHNLHDFEDDDAAIYVYDEKSSDWHRFINNAYIESVAGKDFNGKSNDEKVVADYFHACYIAVKELTSNQPLA
jgi:hypothetical protein